MNMVDAHLTRSNDAVVVSFGDHRLIVEEQPALRGRADGPLVLGIRPEEFEDAAFASGLPVLETTCTLREALGSEVLVHFPVSAAGATFVARVHPQTSAREGQPLRIAVETKRLHFFDPQTGIAL
jgi:multiple sugar transport system ATP-binding protein